MVVRAERRFSMLIPGCDCAVSGATLLQHCSCAPACSAYLSGLAVWQISEGLSSFQMLACPAAHSSVSAPAYICLSEESSTYLVAVVPCFVCAVHAGPSRHTDRDPAKASQGRHIGQHGVLGVLLCAGAAHVPGAVSICADTVIPWVGRNACFKQRSAVSIVHLLV